MASAQQQWHAEALLPPAAVRVRSFKTHAVDTNTRAFEWALRGLLMVALTDQRPPRWCLVHTTPAAGPLPDGLAALLDAGHPAQAAELLLALLPGEPAAQRTLLRRRFLQELQLLGDPVTFAALVRVLFPEQGSDALRTAITTQQADLREEVAGRNPRSWGNPELRERLMRRLSGPLEPLGPSLAATLHAAALLGRQQELWDDVCTAVVETACHDAALPRE